MKSFNQRTRVNIIFDTTAQIMLDSDGFCGVRIINRNGSEMVDNDGFEWVPSCVSFRRATPVVGYVAHNDAKSNPKSVIFGIFDMFGKRYSQLMIPSQWNFDIIPTANDRFVFDVATRHVTPEEVLSIIMQEMKQILLSLAEKDIPIEIKTNFSLSEKQKTILNEICTSIDLPIQGFVFE
uniref:Uncharacterized protein n=1 Tax=Panagrolaimus sp. JU765 TaxID=591449 RepID=A0AC34RRK2_9BILA